MSYDRRRGDGGHGGADAIEHGSPGKRTLTGGLRSGPSIEAIAEAVALQLSQRASFAPAADAHAVAASGFTGSAQPLPHLETIQRAFGRHDVSGVSAHVGGAAATASDALGARAYASGDQVAFAESPDLFLVAHEAAHVVQQRGGVALKSGMGEVGDRYERHADEVAALVVQGRSAEGLLDRHAAGGAVQAVQLATLEGGGARWEVRVDRVTPAGGRPPSTTGVIAFSATAGASVSGREVESGIGLAEGSLAQAEPTRCYDGSAVVAFAPAGGREAAQQEGAPPARGGGGDVIAQVRAWIAERNQQEAVEADESSAAWTQFTARFNTEFANILTELGAGEEGFTSEQLQGMFTERQRELLEQYMTPAHPIPEGLFNGTERGGATGPQRNLISSHMLVHGNYQHREDAGRREPETGSVRAQSCGHWARLVLDYAGTSADDGAGLPNTGPDYGHLRNEESDIEGGLVPSQEVLHGGSRAGDAPAGYTDPVAPADLSAEDAARWGPRNERREAMAGATVPQERVDDLQAGDWLYIFNDQGRGDVSSFGQHSVIFIRWEEEPSLHDDGYYYGRAVTQDQLSPSQGGQQHELNLGTRYRATRPRIFPVTAVMRVTDDTGPARPEAGGPPPGD